MDAFEAGTAIISILTTGYATGYGLGVWRERRRRSEQSIVAALSRVRSALGSIRFQEFQVSPTRAPLSSQLTLDYTLAISFVPYAARGRVLSDSSSFSA